MATSIENLRRQYEQIDSMVASDTLFAAEALLFIAEKLEAIEKAVVGSAPGYVMGAPLGVR